MTREEAEEYAKEMTYRDAINNLMQARSIPYRKATFIKFNELLKALEQEPKTGHWIAQDIYNCHTNFKCSECGYIHSFMHLYGKPTADYTYCPNCGARMVKEQESEVNNG